MLKLEWTENICCS